MIVLVTGASGFIGGALVRALEACGDIEVHGVSRRATALARYHRRDLSRPFDLDVVPDAVVHAAALASPWGSRRAFERHNVEAVRRVVDFCERTAERRGGAFPRLLFLSSTSVFYREADQTGLTEASPIGPAFLNAYARTKAAGERVATGYAGRSVVVRPRAVFGPGDTVLFPRLLRAARARRLPLLERPTGPAIGDLIGIDALCDYLARLLVHPDPAPAYNLTNAEPVALETLLLDVLARLDLPVPTRRVPVGRALAAASALETLWRTLLLPGEPPATRFGVATMAFSKTFDVSLALADLGPPSVGLDEGVERFVAWQRSRGGA